MDAISAATPLYVNGTSGDDNYDGTSPLVIDDKIGPMKNIQTALDAVDDDGTVNVAEGTYRESLTIKRNVMLNGSGSDKTELIPAQVEDNVITISSGVTKATVNGFTITGAINGVGIVNQGTGVTISNNNITDNGNGIVAAEKSETFITGNMIVHNDVGLISGSESTTLHFNSIYGNGVPLNNIGALDATYNWWGSNSAPEIEGVKNSPWLYMTFTPDPTIVLNGSTSQLTANFNNEYDGNIVSPFDPAKGHLPDGCSVTFTTNLGSVGSKTTTRQTINGVANAILTADEGIGTATVSAQMDHEILESTILIINSLYVNVATGNDSWSGTSPNFISGTTGPLKTIQTAINKINSGGTIEIAPGTYYEHLTIAKSMTINGNNPYGTIIDGTSNDRVINIVGGPTVNINNLTMRNGNATLSAGGALLNNGGTVNISDSVLSDNTAVYVGGAICNSAGTLTIYNSSLIRNNATSGGAIFNGGLLSIVYSSLYNNNANDGGVIYNYDGTVNISDSYVLHNIASNKGGAIYNIGTTGTVNIYNSQLNVNNATSGGVIYNLAGNINISNSSVLANNNASSDGGVIYNELGNLIIDDSFLGVNKAQNGGAIYNYDSGTINITNSQLSGNIVTDGGGAIYNDGIDKGILNYATISISDSTLFGNKAGYGGAIHNYDQSKITISNSSMSNNNASTIGGAINNYKGEIIIHFNRIMNNTPTAIYNNAGIINASYNWWGNNSDPYVNIIGSGNLTPWLVLSSTAYPTLIGNNFTSNIVVDLQHDNGILSDPTHPELYYHNPAMGHILNGIPLNFSTSLGTIGILSYMVNGTAQSIFNGGIISGLADVSAKVDNETVHAFVTIDTIAPIAWSNVNSGLYNVNKLVSLFISKSGNIYYTTNGFNPSISSAKFISPILITSSTILKFFAVDAAGNPSPVYTAIYTIDKIAPKITYTYPKNYATRKSRTATLYFKFSENIKASTYWSKIYVKNLKTGKKVSIRKWISGRTLYIKTTSRRSAYTWYLIYIPYKAVKDYAGNNLLTSRIIKFKTGR